MVRAKLSLLLARLFLAAGRTREAFQILCQIKASGVRMRGTDLLRAKCKIRENHDVDALEMLKEELRLFPSNGEARRLLEERSSRPAGGLVEGDAEVAGLLEVVGPYTMLGRERLFSLFSLAKQVCEKDLAGNFVECGVAGGGSSALLAWVIKTYSKRARRLYSFDTFAGMPVPGERDVHGDLAAEDSGWGTGTCAAPVESLLEVCAKLGVTELVVPVQGLFQDTLAVRKGEIGAISLLHLDGDWYDSTKSILDHLYDQVVEGGYLQVDDYGYWEGCRQAVTDFAGEVGEVFEVVAIDNTGVYFSKKGKGH
jgi:hypothetical protein